MSWLGGCRRPYQNNKSLFYEDKSKLKIAVKQRVYQKMLQTRDKH